MMQIRTASENWRKCDAGAIASELRKEQQARRAQAPNRSKSGAHARATDMAIRRAEQSDRIAIATMKRVERELGLLNEGKVWGKPLYISMPRRTRRAIESVIRSASSKALRALPAYRSALRDQRGRVAVMMRMRYMGFKSPKWRNGCAAEHVVYILRIDALNADDRTMGWVSNMGLDAAEVTDAWKVLEEVEKGYRASAIVQYRMLLQLPYELDAAQQARLVETFCERIFGRLGLPYVAAIHKPDADGDQRNYHAHICFSTRPTERIAPFVWRVAQEKVNQLTDAEGIKLIRAQFAAILNGACKKAGLDKRYTHQTYQQRGLDAQRTEHYGPARAGAFRRGEKVDLVNKNALVIDRNEAADDVRIARTRCELAGRRDHALAMLAGLKAQREQLVILGSKARSLGPVAKEVLTRVVGRASAGMRSELQRRHSAAVAISLRAAALQPALELRSERFDASAQLKDKMSKAEAAKLAIGAATRAVRHANDAINAAERLRQLQRWAVETARLVGIKTKREQEHLERQAKSHAAAGKEQAERAEDDLRRARREGSSTSMSENVTIAGSFEGADARISYSSTSDRRSSANDGVKAASAAEKPLRDRSVAPGTSGPSSRDTFEDIDEMELLERIERERIRLIKQGEVIVPRAKPALTPRELACLLSLPTAASSIKRRQDLEIRTLGDWLKAQAHSIARGMVELTPDARQVFVAFRKEKGIVTAVKKVADVKRQIQDPGSGAGEQLQDLSSPQSDRRLAPFSLATCRRN